jgi:hypothetical protein
MGAVDAIPTLLGIAVLLPLISFGIIVFFGPKLGPHGKYAGYVACAAIGSGFVLSLLSLAIWLGRYSLPAPHVVESHAEHATASIRAAHEAARRPSERVATPFEFTSGAALRDDRVAKAIYASESSGAGDEATR